MNPSMNSLMKQWVRKPTLLLAGILLLAIAQRLVVLLVKLPTINSDEAIIGLMARHILAGERPLFYYGQSYYGPLDAYLNAFVFSIWGSSDLALRALPFLCSLLFIVGMYALGRRIYSEQVGLVSALVAAICPAFLAVRGIKGDAAYSLVLLLSALSLFLFQDWLAHPSRLKLAGLVVVTLLGIWIFPLMLYGVFAMGVTWLLTIIRRASAPQHESGGGRRKILLFGGTALALAAAYLAFKMPGGPGMPPGLSGASGVFTYALPIFWGLIPPAEDYAVFMHAIAVMPAWKMPVIVTLSLVVFAAGIIYGSRQFPGQQPLLFIFVTGSGLLYLLFFIMVGISPQTLSFPRYLFPLYSSIPFWVNGLLQLGRKNRLAQVGLVALVLAVNVASVVSIPAEPAPPQGLLDWFAQNPGVDGVYTGYWTGYWLAFESQERIIPVIISEENKVGGNRYLPYVEQARAWRDPVYIYKAGAVGEAGLRDFLSRNAIAYQQTQIGAYRIYHPLSQAVACREKGLELIALRP
jgi:hypothetical protein